MPTTNRSARAFAMSFRRICGLTVAVVCQLGLLLTPSALRAQTATVSILHSFAGTTDSQAPNAALIQAGDGNLYGTTLGNLFTDYGSLFQITPSGTLTQLYSFSGGSDSATPFASLIQGSDGGLYGTTYGNLISGTDGSVFKLPFGGTTLDTLFTFTGDANGGFPFAGLVEGSDGNYYGTTSGGGIGGTLFRVTPAGVLTTLVSFSGSGLTGSFLTSPPVEFTDGNFYGTTNSGGVSNFGVFYQLTPAGTYSALYSFTGTGDGASPAGTPVAGSDGNFYGATGSNASVTTPDMNGTIYRMTPGGVLTTLHTFNGTTDGAGPVGLIMGSDGNLYGAAGSGGTNGNGTLFEVTTTGTFTVLYSFGSTATDGNIPAALLQASDGNFYGTTSAGGANAAGTVFKLSPATALPAPVQITPSASMIPLGDPVTLNWQVLNAFSNTMRYCYASVQTTASGPGAWTGLQTGTYNATTHIYSGSATITPTASGPYTYGLTCGGVESGTATVTVGGAQTLVVTTSNLPQARVDVAYSTALVASGGVPPYTWSLTVGSLPAGLTLNASSGVISGKPTAAGMANFTVQVKDSDPTPATATASLGMTVVQPLVITTMSLPAVRVGSTYSQTLTATGGTPPYIWKQSSGNLPAGLQLSSAGVISGTVTAAGPATFAVSVSDSAAPVAQSVTGNLSIVAEPLIVPTGAVTLSPSTISIGQTTTVTLNLSAPAGSPVATGNVQFVANGANFGSPVPVVNGSASLTSPAFNATGSYEITANYTGDPNYMALNFPPAILAVTTAPALAIQATPSVLSATSGASATTSIAVYNANGAAIKFACSGLPVNAVCNFGPLSSSGTTSLQIAAYTTASLSRPELRGRSIALNLAWLLPGMLALGAFTRKRRRIVLLGIAALLLVATTSLSGCSGGSPATADSPKGTSSVVVTATVGSQTASTLITLTVQ
ncbi:S-layer family protein [Granulicella mallensis]|uniref:Putative repeat protein (TIGR03803 family) n=1 Tax=Granulicella mallensis TaxID=940614 RepID=A0A7W7ZR69_9BACT|nr:choice-of-anchor tandem repeat GloVer-containing protein [Granulicella mallensis]MBB5064304.1 putative repeat protein (TIGR03803 family) [Granulicella mallensis]